MTNNFLTHSSIIHLLLLKYKHHFNLYTIIHTQEYNTNDTNNICLFHLFSFNSEKLILINNIILLDTTNILLKERVRYLEYFGCYELYDQQFSYMRANL